MCAAIFIRPSCKLAFAPLFLYDHYVNLSVHSYFIPSKTIHSVKLPMHVRRYFLYDHPVNWHVHRYFTYDHRVDLSLYSYFIPSKIIYMVELPMHVHRYFIRPSCKLACAPLFYIRSSCKFICAQLFYTAIDYS